MFSRCVVSVVFSELARADERIWDLVLCFYRCFQCRVFSIVPPAISDTTLGVELHTKSFL